MLVTSTVHASCSLGITFPIKHVSYNQFKGHLLFFPFLIDAFFYSLKTHACVALQKQYRLKENIQF